MTGVRQVEADVILPGAAYTEKDATYVNTEGRPQRAVRAVFAPGEAREDWTIIRALSEVLGKTLHYDTLEQLRSRLQQAVPHLAQYGEVSAAPWHADSATAGAIEATPFTYPVQNFYMTDPISRISKTMAECSAVLVEGKNTAQEAA